MQLCHVMPLAASEHSLKVNNGNRQNMKIRFQVAQEHILLLFDGKYQKYLRFEQDEKKMPFSYTSRNNLKWY